MPTLTRSKRKRQEAELEQELRRCAADGDLARARELIELERVNVNCSANRERGGASPLHFATVRGHVAMIRFLLQKGANVNATDIHNNAVLVYAIILRGRNPNLALARLLLEYGADVEMKCHDPSGRRDALPLLAIAINRGNADLVRLLLEFRAETRELSTDGKTYNALFIACRTKNSDLEIVQLLLDHNDGVNVNSFFPRAGKRPALSLLCLACQRNNMQVAQLLIRNGAQVIPPGVFPDSPSPLRHAVKKGSLELLGFLLGKSYLPANRDNNNNPRPLIHPLTRVLIYALRHTKLEAAELLLNHGANVNEGTLLHGCVHENCYESARFLLQNGCNVNQINKKGRTPIWGAASRGNVKLLRLFLEGGANAGISDNSGETPLGVAHRKENKEIAYWLLRTSPNVWPKLRGAW